MNFRCLSLLLILFPLLAESTQQLANNGNDRVSESQAIGQPNRTALQANKEFMRNALFLYTVQYSDLKAVLPWLRNGTNPNIIANQGSQRFVTVVEGTSQIEEIAAKEITPLFFAIIRCKEKFGNGRDEHEKRSAIPIIRALLAHGANPNAEAEIKFGFNNYQNDFTPLSLAAYISCNSIIKDLIIAGGDPNGLIDRRVVERRADGSESGQLLEVLSNTPLITTDMRGGGEFMPYINPEPEMVYRNWLIVRKLLLAGATEDSELITDILTNALKLYSIKDWGDVPLHWDRLLPQTQEDVQWLMPRPQDPLTVTIRQSLEPHLINDLTDIVLGYATRFWMHPDVEQIIRAKIQEQDNEVQEHKERQGSK